MDYYTLNFHTFYWVNELHKKNAQEKEKQSRVKYIGAGEGSLNRREWWLCLKGPVSNKTIFWAPQDATVSCYWKTVWNQWINLVFLSPCLNEAIYFLSVFHHLHSRLELSGGGRAVFIIIIFFMDFKMAWMSHSTTHSVFWCQ